MKILIITNKYPPSVSGGYELRCKEQAEELRRRGHCVFVLTSKAEPSGDRDDEKVFWLLRTRNGRGDNRKRSRAWFWMRKRCGQLWNVWANRHNYLICRRVINKIQPDVGYIWQLNGAMIKTILAIQKAKIPTIFNVGDYWLRDIKIETETEPIKMKRTFRLFVLGLKKFSCLDTRYILTNSLSLRQKYIEAGFEEKSISVIPRGIPASIILKDADLSTASGNHNEKVRFAFVGRLVPEKAPDLAIRALAHIIHQAGNPNVYLDIIGTGEERYIQELKKLVSSLDVYDNIQFIGQLEHDELLLHYERYRCLLFTSRWDEPFSSVIVEAMAKGVAVVATKSGSVSEVIEDNINGIIVPKDQPVPLARAVMRVINESELSRSIRCAALSTIRQKFSFGPIVDQTEYYLRKAKKEYCETLKC